MTAAPAIPTSVGVLSYDQSSPRARLAAAGIVRRTGFSFALLGLALFDLQVCLYLAAIASDYFGWSFFTGIFIDTRHIFWWDWYNPSRNPSLGEIFTSRAQDLLPLLAIMLAAAAYGITLWMLARLLERGSRFAAVLALISIAPWGLLLTAWTLAVPLAAIMAGLGIGIPDPEPSAWWLLLLLLPLLFLLMLWRETVAALWFTLRFPMGERKSQLFWPFVRKR